MHSSTKTEYVVNVRITHKTARVPLMEAVVFKDKEQALAELHTMENVTECLILQTCNRIELYIVSEEGEKTSKIIKQYLASRASLHYEEVFEAIEIALNHDAYRHLLKITAGLESMIIGEEQILNQVWDAYLEAEKAKCTGSILKHLFNRAMTVGHRIRDVTGINKGAVSVGSAAVALAANLLNNLDDKKILVMGAGEIGTLVAKALARRCLSPIFIANRTYARAVTLAEDLSGRAVNFDKFPEILVDADVVICATSAPHILLSKDIVSCSMRQRVNRAGLIIIDLSNPRNVEKAVEAVLGVRLYSIDDLQLIAEKNLAERQKCVDIACRMIDDELVILDDDLKKLSVRLIISSLLSNAEQIRQVELAKAIDMLGEDVDDRKRKVIDDLTSVLLKQTFLPVIENLRVAASNDDRELIGIAIKLFDKLGKTGADVKNV
ncbi:MAG: glutamyl-tRNA reductase [Candidatus Bathyarchaeota archaeon]|nr:glutamyl-tRNA reductase [Candidatus Termiticorpusculum sp.]